MLYSNATDLKRGSSAYFVLFFSGIHKVPGLKCNGGRSRGPSCEEPICMIFGVAVQWLCFHIWINNM